MKLNHRVLRDFMLERHKIYTLKTMGAARPWSRDSILNNYKFTNVYRELDRVTVWIRQHIREPYADHPNLWFMLCIARQINWPPTLTELIDCGKRTWPLDETWDWRASMGLMRAMAKGGHKVYTGAYMLTANAGGLLNKVPGMFDKPEITCKLVLNGVWKDRAKIEPRMHTTMQEATEVFKDKYTGFGGFMAYEVTCDLRHTRYLRNAPDKLTWAHAGPGALRGLNRLLGKPAKQRPFLSTDAAVDAMQHLLEKIHPDWPYDPPLEMREIEHSLCEFDKYERARLGEGRPRSQYREFNGW